MANEFDEYINQLRQLEITELKTKLKSLQELHKPVISFFSAISDGIDRLLSSDSISAEVISDIHAKLPDLATCKSSYEKLSSSKVSRLDADDIKQLLARKHSITLHDVASYDKEITILLKNNEAQLKIED